MKWACFLLLFLTLISCSSEKKNSSKETSDNSKTKISTDSNAYLKNAGVDAELDRNSVVARREFQVEAGKSLIIVEHYGDGFSARDITVATKGFRNENVFNYESAGYIDSAMAADLNQDGQKEFYVTIGNGGSGGMEDLWVFTVVNDELVKVDTKEIDRVTSGEYFDVSKIQGHDNYHIERNYLVNTVPLYNEDDPNCCPTGGKMKIYYGFERTEKGSRLFFVRKD